MPHKAKAVGDDDRNYFGEEEEKAVIEYLNCESTIQKNRIFERKLRKPFEKMVACIIKRYGYRYGSEPYEETFYEALSDLITKLDKFNADGTKKAYSYYGTICRNHLKERFTTKVRKDDNNPPCDMSEEQYANNIKYAEVMEKDMFASDMIKALTKRFKYMLEQPEAFMLRESEIAVGKALIKLFENWEYVLDTGGSEKMNKSSILAFLRDETGMKTKSVRDNLRKYCKEYLIVRHKMVNS